MSSTFLIPELRELISQQNVSELQFFLEDLHPAVAAEFLQPLEPHELVTIFSWIETELATDIFTNLAREDQLKIVRSTDPAKISKILDLMPPDDRADLFNKLEKHEQEKVLPALEKGEREDLRKLAAYREGSAGSVMTTDYVSLFPSMTAADSIGKLRKEAPRRETIYYAYCIDNNGRLIGFVSLKDLILAEPQEKIVEFMHTEVVSINCDIDREEAAQAIQRYDLIAIPVTDDDGILVGIITHDDAIDIITQEHTEDMEKLMAISGSHEAAAYLKTSSLVHFRNRAGWLVGLSAAGMISGTIIHSYEHTLNKFMILALYMPMIADSGGNAGSQASTVVIRSLALKEIVVTDIWKVIFKEFKISLMLSFILGGMAWAKVMFLSAGSDIPEGISVPTIAGIIGLALAMQVISSAIIGVILPLTAARLEFDPALIASPALTTLVDITGLLIYFNIATYFLGI